MSGRDETKNAFHISILASLIPYKSKSKQNHRRVVAAAHYQRFSSSKANLTPLVLTITHVVRFVRKQTPRKNKPRTRDSCCFHKTKGLVIFRSNECLSLMANRLLFPNVTKTDCRKRPGIRLPRLPACLPAASRRAEDLSAGTFVCRRPSLLCSQVEPNVRQSSRLATALHSLLRLCENNTCAPWLPENQAYIGNGWKDKHIRQIASQLPVTTTLASSGIYSAKRCQSLDRNASGKINTKTSLAKTKHKRWERKTASKSYILYVSSSTAE